MTYPNDFFGPHVLFGWSTRADGPTNEVGHAAYDEERRANRAAFLRNEMQSSSFVVPRLSHGAVCEAVALPAPTEGIVRADALITDQKGLTLALGMGDCFPVFFHDPKKEVIGIAHVGWRGALAGIVRSTVDKMVKEYGCYRDDIRAMIGPGICFDCFELGPEVLSRFGISSLAPHRFDLEHEIDHQLVDAGIFPAHIGAAISCTAHTKDGKDGWLFFSHRRDKADPLNTQLAAIRMH